MQENERTGTVSKRMNKVEGFTLLEVLVALAVMATALVALHQGFSSVLQARLATERLWQVMLHANNEVMQLERLPSAGLSQQKGEYEENHPLAGVSWQREVRSIQLIPGIVLRHVIQEWSWRNGARRYRKEIFLPIR